MEVRKVYRDVLFKNGHFARFEFSLVESEAFSYGNGTSVTIIDSNTAHPAANKEFLDTRYDTSLRRDGSNFEEWVDEYIDNRFGGLVRKISKTRTTSQWQSV